MSKPSPSSAPPDAGAVHVVVLVEVADALLTQQAQVDEVLIDQPLAGWLPLVGTPGAT